MLKILSHIAQKRHNEARSISFGIPTQNPGYQPSARSHFEQARLFSCGHSPRIKIRMLSCSSSSFIG